MDDEGVRRAIHAGSWYSDDKAELSKQLQAYLDEAKVNDNADRLKSVIVPHAGYRYSGKTAAWAYKNINNNLYDRVVLLGPSHKVFIPGCGLTQQNSFETPLGNIKVDIEAVQSLLTIKGFYPIDKETDENEHSLEMQLPFIKYIFQDKDIMLLPIMVGHTSLEQDNLFANALSEYYNDKRTLFVISSDFCHWGKRFSYTYTNNAYKNIYESIEFLDRVGMDCIESLDPETFDSYLKDHKNTICGRRAITILLCIIKMNMKQGNSILFVKYDQSSQVVNMNDSSVSYAAGLNFIL
jgi:AmmeMemoRadiSam system protein B